MTLVERLLAEQACQRVLAQAARCVDTRDFEGFASLFAPEGVLQRPGGEPIVGRAAIAAAYKGRAPGRMTRHLLTNVIIDVASPTTACALASVLLWSADEASEPTPQGRPAHARQLLGTFEDRFVCVEGRWLIEERAARFDMYIDGAG